MTNILQYPTTTSSNSNNIIIPSLNTQSLTSNPKSTTIVIQHPSSSITIPNTLLIKRRNPAELGDMLMKKIKSKTGTYDDNSSQNNSIYDSNSYESPVSSRINENIEANSMVEDMASPSTRSIPEDLEIPPVKKISLVQKSLIVPNRQAIKVSRNEAADNQKQIKQALEMLQKKMLLDQVASLREAFLKERIAQEPLYIPPLMSLNDAPRVQEDSFCFNDDEEQPKVFIGTVEYPLLSQANTESAQKGSVLNIPTSLLMLSNAKISTNSHRSLLDSLCVTRAETQRSGSDGSPSQVNEEFLQAAEGRKKRVKKVKDEVNEKVKKAQKKERKPAKGRGKAKNESCLSESSQSP